MQRRLDVRAHRAAALRRQEERALARVQLLAKLVVAQGDLGALAAAEERPERGGGARGEGRL
eukprot:2017984-Prymnesium_polylepis.1